MIGYIRNKLLYNFRRVFCGGHLLLSLVRVSDFLSHHYYQLRNINLLLLVMPKLKDTNQHL